jgi:ABC-type Zn uptake system ZnuABC Zn-binding protein ZnuA
MRPGGAPRLALLTCVLLLALSGCGESEQAKAEKTVCTAKTQISTSVQSLQKETAQTVTLSGVESNLRTITENLQKIGQAQSKLSSSRKEQVQKASEAFSAELDTLTHELTSLSLTTAKSQLTAAVEKLAAGYKQALAPVQC